VQIQDCNRSRSQRWKVRTDGTITGAASGLCLDIASTDLGATLMLATCDRGVSQKWTRR
jgi:alpha-galactosidase